MSGDTLRDWSVDIHESGRSGNVIYRDAGGSLSFYWEFGGGDTVATIDAGSEAQWLTIDTQSGAPSTTTLWK